MDATSGPQSGLIMTKHEKALNFLAVVAEGIARRPMSSGARVAASIIYKNKIISVGTNSLKSHPFQKKFASGEHAIYLHAETDAIRLALRYLTEAELAKATLYVCRVKHENGAATPLVWGLSKPCIGCQRAIATFNISKVVYSGEGTRVFFFL